MQGRSARIETVGFVRALGLALGFKCGEVCEGERRRRDVLEGVI
jgi:hypothetical protein